jgi:protein involved in polysaccharide export with SLBB domain
VIYILASARARYEFDTEAAINDAGGFAVVPRWVEIIPAKDGKPERMEYRPLLPRMMFLACSESQWHQFHGKRLHGPNGILPPIRRDLEILSRTWADFQSFAARAEQECEYRIAMHEQGRKVRNYRRGDIIRIIGTDMLDGLLRDQLARFVKLDKGKVIAETSVMFMGKPVTARLDPAHVTGMAAE